MEGAVDVPPMDLKASAENEVRKLQDMVKKLEKQNELLRNTQNGALGGVAEKRESLDLEDVALINLNDSADDLEDSWLYESPVKQATPAQKSVSSLKWAKTVTADGLDDVRKCLIDKLDDIEAQQEISKVRTYQKPEGRISLMNTPKDSMFFQPTNRAAALAKHRASPVQFNSSVKQLKSEENQSGSYPLDSSPHGSVEENLDDELQGPILRRSNLVKKEEPKSELEHPKKTSQSGSASPLESRRQANGTAGPLPRRSIDAPDENLRIQPRSRGMPVVVKSEENQSESYPLDSSPHGSVEDDLDDEPQGPILRRSNLVKKEEPKGELQRSKKTTESGSASPIESRRQANGSAGPAPRKSVEAADENLRIQPRSRRMQLVGGDNNATEKLETSSQSSQDDVDDDFNDKAPVVRRSALALPKPSSEGLSKQLWYSGPISQMNQQRTKGDPAAARIKRSASPSPDRRSKLQPRSAASSAVPGRRSTGSRGSMEDLLDVDDSAPVQRRSLPQIPTDANGVRSRLTKSDESMAARSQLKPRGKAQNLVQPATQGAVVTRRSMLTPPSSASNSPKNTRGVVARRRASPQNLNDSNLDDSWKEGCY